MTGNQQLRRRFRPQSGNILWEFVAVVFVITPLIAGTFVTGLNLVRSIQANHMARDVNNMYILGADFSSHSMQQLAKRLATGLNLQVGSATTGNDYDNSDNGGNGIVWVTKLQWIGATNQPICQAISPATCTNAGKFVVLEQVRFGNRNLDSATSGADPNASHITTAGHPNALPDPYGKTTVDTVQNAAAQVPEPYQTKLYNLWQTTHAGAANTSLADGQFLYMTEVYFRQTGSLAGQGVYARWFF
jgi:hypothetical protein